MLCQRNITLQRASTTSTARSRPVDVVRTVRCCKAASSIGIGLKNDCATNMYSKYLIYMVVLEIASDPVPHARRADPENGRRAEAEPLGGAACGRWRGGKVVIQTDSSPELRESFTPIHSHLPPSSLHNTLPAHSFTHTSHLTPRHPHTLTQPNNTTHNTVNMVKAGAGFPTDKVTLL